jgi:hypothetical protein
MMTDSSAFSWSFSCRVVAYYCPNNTDNAASNSINWLKRSAILVEVQLETFSSANSERTLSGSIRVPRRSKSSRARVKYSRASAVRPCCL